MKPFTTLFAVAIPIDDPDVDTDRIVPARFLRNPRAVRYGQYLFYDVRFGTDGTPNSSHPLNRPEYRDAEILVANENFGCGSSREAAVWALCEHTGDPLRHGIRAVLAPSFGDIFYSNACKNGVLPVRLTSEVCARMRSALHRDPGARISIDLAAQTVRGPDGEPATFEIHPFQKQCLLHGLDEIDLTEQHEDAIRAHEERARRERPWVVLE